MEQAEYFVMVEEIYQIVKELRKQTESPDIEENLSEKNFDLETEPILFFACERSLEMVKNYCYIEQVPKELKNVCVEIALLLYDNGGYQSKNTTLKSIKEGNVSVTYQSEASAWKENKKTLLEELDKFRKLKW